jgi:NADH-quinone oxidoreductase subunit A
VDIPKAQLTDRGVGDTISRLAQRPVLLSLFTGGEPALISEVAVLPLFLFALLAAGLCIGMLIAGRLFGPRRDGPVKQMPYECGVDPVHDARRRFDVRFYLMAVAFLVFDVELLFLYPWAVARNNPEGIQRMAAGPEGESLSRSLIFGEVMFFIALLALGLVYIWRKGVLRWR